MSINMKILFIITQSEFGGAQRYIYEITSHLDPQQYEVVLAAGQGDDELMLNVKYQRLKYLKRVPFLSTILAIWEIKNLLKKGKPDVLFLCSTTAGILGSIAGWLYKKRGSSLKIIYRIGGWAFRDPRPSWQNKIIIWIEKLTAQFKDKIIVNSEIDRQLALQYKIAPENKIIKIHNGVDVNELKFLPPQKARQRLLSRSFLDSLIIGVIANFYKTKGLEHLIEAADILNSKFLIRNSKFVIIGDGKERSRLEGLIKKYGLENTVFLVGRISDARKYLKALDIFVLPSIKEGFPWVILEAMAARIPIVATKVGAVAEIIENTKEGLLVEAKNSQALAEKIIWLLKRPKQAQQMARQARKKVEKQFTLRKMIESTVEVIKGG